MPNNPPNPAANPSSDRGSRPTPPGRRPSDDHGGSRSPETDLRKPPAERRDVGELEPALRGMYYLG
jgi:hypothetical protein